MITNMELIKAMKVFQTGFEFLNDDIERFREQQIPPDCFSMLHTWDYNLDSIDLALMQKFDMANSICEDLELSFDA